MNFIFLPVKHGIPVQKHPQILYFFFCCRDGPYNGRMRPVGSDACRAMQAGRTPRESRQLLPPGAGGDAHRFTSTEGQ